MKMIIIPLLRSLLIKSVFNDNEILLFCCKKENKAKSKENYVEEKSY